MRQYPCLSCVHPLSISSCVVRHRRISHSVTRCLSKPRSARKTFPHAAHLHAVLPTWSFGAGSSLYCRASSAITSPCGCYSIARYPCRHRFVITLDAPLPNCFCISRDASPLRKGSIPYLLRSASSTSRDCPSKCACALLVM